MAGSCAGAQSGSKAEQAFNEAVRQYETQYSHLLHTRGVPDPAPVATEQQPLGLAPLPASRALFSLESLVESLERDYPTGSALLFYSYRNDALSMWLIDTTGILAFDSVPVLRESLQDTITQLHASIGVTTSQKNRAARKRSAVVLDGFDPDEAPAPQRGIQDAGALLLPPPIRDKLPSVKHLIIIPVLGIGTVPFAILPVGMDDSLLIEQMTLSTAPSILDILSDPQPWHAHFQRPLVVGNPTFAPDNDWLVPPLPGAEREALAVAELVQGKVLLQDRATKQSVLELAPQSDFLYFGTHGMASSDDPLSGGFLMLAADEFREGWWTAKEIQEMRLRARIAILSACQTGLGQVHDAGVIGLSRAFQIAGVPRVVMSLWSVDDEATAELMEAFVRHLQTAPMPSAALREAMLEVREMNPAPAQWASFVLFGTPR